MEPMDQDRRVLANMENHLSQLEDGRTQTRLQLPVRTVFRPDR